MKVYLAGEGYKKEFLINKLERGEDVRTVNVLETFYYLRKQPQFWPYIHSFGSFMLDSGIFTYLAGTHKGKTDWDDYVERYADFINTHRIDLFVEVDIESIVGMKEMERLRAKLERLTGMQPIPVWHIKRGKDYHIATSRDYPYVAFGGLMTDGISRQQAESIMPWAIDVAHSNGAKIHGLGYTSTANLHKYCFDSVDSTAWLYGNMGGYIYLFNRRLGVMEQRRKEGCRLADSKKVARHNLGEWIKFSQYAAQYL
ncbi:MAG: hypothetical protein LIO91_03595 [Bacteroidales bacterium]|nr:hypothetical protein [Bacteroidales bacterium]